MMVLIIITLFVALLFFLLQKVIRATKTEATAVDHPTLERSRFSNSRGNFVASIIGGYLIAAIATLAVTAMIEGTGGLSAGIFVFLASPIYAIPVLAMAASIGYPVYRYCRKDSIAFLPIWFSYSAAALASALSTALLASLAIDRSLDGLLGMSGFMCIISLLVAIPSALLTWVRQRNIIN